MKKIMFISMLSLGIVNFSEAQFKPNDVAFGLLINPYHNETDYLTLTDFPYLFYDKNRGFEVTPSAGVFVSKHLELGIGIGFSWNKQHTRFDSLQERTAYGRSINFSIYGKNYFPLSEIFSITLAEAIGYNRGLSHVQIHYFNPESVENSDQKIEGFSLGISPGFSYFPVKKIQLTAFIGNLGFSKSITRDKADNHIVNKQNYYGLRLTFDTIAFGIHYIF